MVFIDPRIMVEKICVKVLGHFYIYSVIKKSLSLSYMRINILEMHSYLDFAGGPRNMFTFVKNLDRNFFNVFVASYVEGGVYEEKLKELGIEFLVSKKDADKILRFIKEKNIHVIHIHRSGGYSPLETAIISGAKKINKEIIIVEKNVFGKYDQVSGRDIDCSMFQSMMHLNERYLPTAKMKFNFSKMKVFYNMVDSAEFEKYRLTKEEIGMYKNNFGITTDNFVLGKVGRADLAKWSDLILDTMPSLIRLVPNIKFIVIGVPPSRVRRIKNSNFANHFILLDETSDERQVHSFYQAIDVLAHSSKIGECNGNTINEAMFWKKPVIVNSTPNKDNGQLEQVTHMVDGIVANYPQTFARAVCYLYRNPAKLLQMGESGHNRILQLNSPALTTRRLEKVIIEKMAENKTPVDLPVKNFYDRISYYPDEQQILNFPLEYRKRLSWEFGKLGMSDKIVNMLGRPKKFYFKIKDFLEHKYRIKI